VLLVILGLALLPSGSAAAAPSCDPATATVRVGDSEPIVAHRCGEAGEITYTVTKPPDLGGVGAMTEGRFSELLIDYTAPAGAEHVGKTDEFEVTARDAAGATSIIHVSVTLVSATSNHLPSCWATTIMRESLAEFMVPCGDEDGDVLTFTVLSPPTHGTLRLPDPTDRYAVGSFAFDPGFGDDQATIRATDELGLTSESVISFSDQSMVAPLPECTWPATPAPYIVEPGASVVIPVSCNGPVLITNTPLYGSATVQNDSQITYTAGTSITTTKTDHISFVAKNDDGVWSRQYFVELTIRPADRPAEPPPTTTPVTSPTAGPSVSPPPATPAVVPVPTSPPLALNDITPPSLTLAARGQTAKAVARRGLLLGITTDEVCAYGIVLQRRGGTIGHAIGTSGGATTVTVPVTSDRARRRLRSARRPRIVADVVVADAAGNISRRTLSVALRRR
jgi:hypothetical protein